MKYFTLNSSDFSILEVFHTLKELRETYPNLDIVDFVDDLDSESEGKIFISEKYISSLIGKTKEGEEESSLRTMISLKEEIDILKEQTFLTNQEIETVHSEYVKIKGENESNIEKIKINNDLISELEHTKESLENDLRKKENLLTLEIKEHDEELSKIAKILPSKFAGVLESKMQEIMDSIKTLDSEIEKYSKGE